MKVTVTSDAQKPQAVAYLRVASPGQADQRRSIDAQQAACCREAQRLGVVLVAEFLDLGVSGNAARRRGLRQLLAYVTNHPVAYVIVSDRARLARSRAADGFIRGRLQQTGVSVAAATDNDPNKHSRRIDNYLFT